MKQLFVVSALAFAMVSLGACSVEVDMTGLQFTNPNPTPDSQSEDLGTPDITEPEEDVTKEITAPDEPPSCWDLSECVVLGHKGCNDVFDDTCWLKCAGIHEEALKDKGVKDFRGCMATHCGTDSTYIMPLQVGDCIKKECLKDFLSCIQLPEGDDWSCAQIWNCFMSEQCLKQGHDVNLQCLTGCTENASSEAIYRLEQIFEACPDPEATVTPEEAATSAFECNEVLYMSCYAQSPPLAGKSCREINMCAGNCGCENWPVPEGEDCIQPPPEDEQTCNEVECFSQMTPDSASLFWQANLCLSNPYANPFVCVLNALDCAEYQSTGQRTCNGVLGSAAMMQKGYDGNIPSDVLKAWGLAQEDVTYVHQYLMMMYAAMDTKQDHMSNLVAVVECMAEKQDKADMPPGGNAYGVLEDPAWIKCENLHYCKHLQ